MKKVKMLATVVTTVMLMMLCVVGIGAETYIGEGESGTWSWTPADGAVVAIDNEPAFLLGDITGNGIVDIADALLLFQYSLMPDVYSVDYPGILDCNGDDSLDIIDALRLFRYSLMPDIYPLHFSGFKSDPVLTVLNAMEFTPAFDGVVYYYYTDNAEGPDSGDFKALWKSSEYRDEVTVVKGQSVTVSLDGVPSAEYDYLMLCLCCNGVEYMIPVAVEIGTEIPPTSVTYAEYLAMTGAEQSAFINSFESTEAFFQWRNAAKAEYEAQNPDIELGNGGDIDLGGN